ncbi:TfoX/Sxy family protein [Methylomonas sp. AM2-LC]|uniref:TfoX/Sxy family protein n=1 Tax=Methylomonas sp. AM2-LC TaxID=3153301 RepID=UPI0032636ED8
MATQQSTVDFILEQIKAAGGVYGKKMFGEYGVFCDNKMVALVCDDELFVKPTVAGREFIENVVESIPYSGAKPCFLISGDKWDDRNWLSNLIRITANELPLPKKKTPPRKKTN